MIIKHFQRPPLIARAALELSPDILHPKKQGIVGLRIAIPYYLVLLNSQGNELVHELRDRESAEIVLRHGLSTPNLIKASIPTRRRSSQLFPLRYCLGEIALPVASVNSSFGSSSQALISQCFSVGIGTSFSGL